MPDWTGSFHAPKFSDEEFEKKHEEYIKKNGWEINVPAIDDIIHLPIFDKMTPEEEKLWKSGKKDQIPEARRKVLQERKDKNRQKFINMMKSPSEKIGKNIGAIMTSIDDCQDAVSTLACIAVIASKLLAKTALKTALGPIGWILMVSDLLKLINPMSWSQTLMKRKKSGRKWKTTLESYWQDQPYSKRGKILTARNIKKFRPSIGNALEALQVTDNIFDVGVSLGSILGFAQDMVSGAVRGISEEVIAIKNDAPELPFNAKVAAAALKAQNVMHGFPWESDIEVEAYSMMAANMSIQVLAPYVKDWNPFVEVENWSDLELHVPEPSNILTIEMLEEEGINVNATTLWPQNGKKWISYDELIDKTLGQAQENLRHFIEKYPDFDIAWIALQNADHYALNFLGTVEEEEDVRIVYEVIPRIIGIILDNGWVYPDDITEGQIKKFEDWCGVHNYMQSMPSTRDIKNYAEVFCGFQWAQSPDEER